MKHKLLIYQVLPRLFGNNKNTNTFNGTLKENGCGKFEAFTAKALEEIKGLGITHIWYTGVLEHATKTDYSNIGIRPDHPAVVKGNAGSPYAIKDYYDVDPDLAVDPTNRINEFESLVDRTHATGLKVIIDFVPNHLARRYHSDAKPEGVRDFGEDDDTSKCFSPQNNFYYIGNEVFAGQFNLNSGAPEPYTESPAKATGNDCFNAYPSMNDWYETVKLNYGVDYMNYRAAHFQETPDTWKKMLEVLLYWAGKKVDGFRCDMAEMVPVAFWEWAITRVKKKFPKVIFIAEVYNPAEYHNYLFNGKFDYLYDKEGLYNTLRAVTTSQTPASNISNCWKQTSGYQERMLSFMENHDEQRIASDFFAGNARHGIPGMIVCATMNTNPVMIYCGQELGEPGMDREGFSGLDGRTTIFDYWNVESISRWINQGTFDGSLLSDDQKEIRAFYRKLLTITKKEVCLKEGSFFDLMYVNDTNMSMNGKQYMYLRKKENTLILVATNFSDASLKLDIRIPLHAFELYGIPIAGFVDVTELLSGEKSQQLLSASVPFRVELNGWSGKILKMKLS
ncbi:MAG: alpha-amylase family protein [Bacteroidales bacterium]|nr:alpha-amylase family protein [Bacteroidales bacterium]